MLEKTAAFSQRQYRFMSMRPLTVWFAAIVLVCILPPSGRTDTPDHPFRPGETLVFKLRWSFIPAGEATLSVLPIERIDGKPAYHFVMTAKTNRFMDSFYKVRDRIDAYADIDMTHTVLYKKKQHEGSTKRDVVVNFDWDKNEAQYITSEDTRSPIAIQPGSFDPLSIFYYARLFNLDTVGEIEHPVTDGKKCVIGKATVIGRETIVLSSGTYDTHVLAPDLKHVGGVFQKSKNAKILLWVTADHRKLPVKIKSKVAVGSFIGELIRVEGL